MTLPPQCCNQIPDLNIATGTGGIERCWKTALNPQQKQTIAVLDNERTLERRNWYSESTATATTITKKIHTKGDMHGQLICNNSVQIFSLLFLNEFFSNGEFNRCCMLPASS
jgi:hypothetical protein